MLHVYLAVLHYYGHMVPIPELEITVGHRSFSDHFRDLAKKIQFARTIKSHSSESRSQGK